ncbi:MAG: hypothetical protein ACRD22_15560, partial [Terriglobia bacterium]
YLWIYDLYKDSWNQVTIPMGAFAAIKFIAAAIIDQYRDAFVTVIGQYASVSSADNITVFRISSTGAVQQLATTFEQLDFSSDPHYGSYRLLYRILYVGNAVGSPKNEAGAVFYYDISVDAFEVYGTYIQPLPYICGQRGAPSGAPPNAPSGMTGSFYFRSDTPTTANQRIYVWDGSTWTGIV